MSTDPALTNTTSRILRGLSATWPGGLLCMAIWTIATLHHFDGFAFGVLIAHLIWMVTVCWTAKS